MLSCQNVSGHGQKNKDASFGSALGIMLDTNEKGAGVCVSFADWYSDN